VVVAQLTSQLEEAKAQRQIHKAQEKERTLAKKYHMVKFVERQKLIRKLSKSGALKLEILILQYPNMVTLELLDKGDADVSSADGTTLDEQKKELEEQLTYVMYVMHSICHILYAL
jgi:hypothetical protein